MEPLRLLFEVLGQGERYQLLNDQMGSLVLLGFYLAFAVLAVLWVVVSLLFGELTDIFDFLDFGDEGTFSALGVGVLIFSLTGALALILGASPLGSGLWAVGGGVLTFLLAVRTMRWLGSHQTSTTVSAERVIGKEGRWILTISEEGECRRGLVEVVIGSMREELRAKASEELQVGDRVRIVRAESARDVEVKASRKEGA